MTNVVAQAVTADTMQTIASCGFSASSAMVGAAWIAAGSRKLSLTSGALDSAIRPSTECSTNFASDLLYGIVDPRIKLQ